MRRAAVGNRIAREGHSKKVLLEQRHERGKGRTQRNAHELVIQVKEEYWVYLYDTAPSWGSSRTGKDSWKGLSDGRAIWPLPYSFNSLNINVDTLTRTTS
jgi:hypothetical protein